MLILLSDFNCALRPLPGGTGAGLLPHLQLRPDLETFSNIVDSLRFCALNTWASRRVRNMPTYRHDIGRTQIDYIFTRGVRADRGTRTSLPTTFDLAPWRGGSKHMLVEATLPLHPGWRSPQSHSQSPHQDNYCKRSLDYAVRDGTCKVDELREEASKRLAGTSDHGDLSLNNILLAACTKVFPKQPGPPIPKAWKQQDVQAEANSLWPSSGHLPITARATAAHGLEASFMHKLLKAKGQQARRQLLCDQLEQSKKAAESHDQHGLYSVIRRIA